MNGIKPIPHQGEVISSRKSNRCTGGIYWNNRGDGAVVINRGYTYGPLDYYNYSLNYYVDRGVVVDRARARSSTAIYPFVPRSLQ